MLQARLRLLVAAIWAGSLWTVGYLAAPTLFATLSDRVLAGTIAASLFNVQAWLSLGCGAAMLVLLAVAGAGNRTASAGVNVGPVAAPRARRTGLLIVAAMLLGTLVVHFGVQPLMAELRAAAGPAGVMESAAKSRFGMLHGVSSGIYLIQSLLAGWLLLRQQ
ncbi:DUF4149 domain-containing protein [Oxalobacteraceae bacterium]|nr:DUF4149 domain-containing protein [Oxalobacteraceae bacterium]